MNFLVSYSFQRNNIFLTPTEDVIYKFKHNSNEFKSTPWRLLGMILYKAKDKIAWVHAY